jgi:hypothetical protein
MAQYDPVLYILLKDIKTTFHYTKSVFNAFQKKITRHGSVCGVYTVVAISDMA